MTPDRWKRIGEIYHSALARAGDERVSCLARECGGDDALRREVESLLDGGEPSESFLEGDALEAAARRYASIVDLDWTGRRLGRYELIARLGQGGMGEVYRARDTRLKREVALKMLPPESMADPVRRRRFEQEARAASALNHPNIVSIHDIDRADGIDFITMEFVPGQTLAARIGRKGLPLQEVLSYAVQIAGALAAVHAAGIVHRDLKPANVMVARSGQVKVVDFGLAKLAELTARALVTTGATPVRTGTGTILGTIAYMSPEQAAGKPVDARSDIFSFGALLYEMLTGKRAFLRDSMAATLAAILKEEPKPAGGLIRGVPPELERILTRCLRKEPERRFQHMDDLQVALEEVREGRRVRGRRALTAAEILVAAGLLAATAWFLIPGRSQPEPVVVPLTTYAGEETAPTFSPDGNQVAFSWDGPRQDNVDIYVKLIGAEKPLRLTSDPARDIWPAWSPDGRSIAFLRGPAAGTEVLLIPAIGGPERKLADTRSAWGLAWSPDGKWLVFNDSDSANPSEQRGSLYALSVETRAIRKLTSAPPLAQDLGAGFSPDGRTLVFERTTRNWFADLYRLALGQDLNPQGEPRQITLQGREASSPAFTPDGREIVYISTGPSSATMWRVGLSGSRRPRSLDFAGEQVGRLAISRQGNRLVYERWLEDKNIWRLELGGRGRRAGQPERLIASTRTDEVPRYSPDGKRIVFLSSRSGHNEVWVSESDSSNPIQLTSLGRDSGSPNWSPDGRRIVFDSFAERQFDVFLIDASGGAPRNLTNHPADDAVASFSRDGRWVYFTSNRTGRFEIWKMPAAGGEALQVTRNGGYIALESPDGKWLYHARICSASELWRLSLSGGTEQKIAEPVIGGSLGMASRGIYFSRPARKDGNTDIEFFSFTTGKITPVATTARPLFWSVSPSSDERYLLYTQVDQSGSDLMLVENFR